MTHERIDKLRDQLATAMGWHRLDLGRWVNRTDPAHKLLRGTHPIPATLDAVAALWPEGWTWERTLAGVKCDDGNTRVGPLWRAAMIGRPWSSGGVSVPDTGNELHDRLALTIAVMVAITKEPT